VFLDILRRISSVSFLKFEPADAPWLIRSISSVMGVNASN
jgi:hypothetical protein